MTPDVAIRKMTARIAGILSENEPSVYLSGSCVLGDFRPGWSDIDLLVLTEKAISAGQAEALVGLRQSMTAAEESNPFYRCFEGGMLTREALLHSLPDRVVYWGTSGQRVTDRYALDACSKKVLLDSGRLLYGREVRAQLPPPSYEALTANVQHHYQTIRQHAGYYGRSLYSYGWILDIARCIYTLRTGAILSKTAAGEWALQAHLFSDSAALESALAVRRNPEKYWKDAALQDLSAELEGTIQKYADVLEAELKALPV